MLDEKNGSFSISVAVQFFGDDKMGSRGLRLQIEKMQSHLDGSISSFVVLSIVSVYFWRKKASCRERKAREWIGSRD